MRSWFSVKMKTAGVLDINIHDEIGLWGVSARDFISEVDNAGEVKSINLSVHSPGGSLIDGLAMYNKLKSHPAPVFGRVEGLAASAASFVLMAADNIAMPENSFLMIHNAWGGGVGDADELREIADTIERMQQTVINIYATRTGMAHDDIADLMAAETWMTAQDAMAYGFADTITDQVEVAAKVMAFNRYFQKPPMPAVEDTLSSITNVREFEQFLRDAGMSKGLTLALVSRVKTLFVGEPENDETEMAKLSARLDAFLANRNKAQKR